MQRNNKEDEAKIKSICLAFTGLEIAKYGEKPPMKQTLHYITLANRLTKRITNSHNTVFKLVNTSDKVELSIIVGVAINEVVVTVENRMLCYN
jgi:hypothetical protein